jgi:hypothetical protein
MAMMLSVIKSASLLFYIQSISVPALILTSPSAYNRSASNREFARNATLRYTKGSVNFRGLSKKDETELCPIDRVSELGVYQVLPDGNKLSEVSYMAHSSQVYKGKAKLVW